MASLQPASLDPTMSLPPLPHIPLATIPSLAPPTPLIRSELDVTEWHKSEGFTNYQLFIQRLNESVVGHDLGEELEESSPAIEAMLAMLDELQTWTDEIPPLASPQRYGNLAFRTWGRRLEKRIHCLLQTHLTPEFHPAIPLLSPYLLTSFGSFLRIDYGSGHELCFALFLLCLALLRFFDPNPIEEKHLVLRVFKKYLDTVWKLQGVYRLEPAGSHGVWGLDDFQFLSYLWGSAQIRNDPDSTPAIVLQSTMPMTNLYTLNIARLHALKNGPFHEHSPQLYSIASAVPNWGKVNSGLMKMYNAEVLGKRVVVQHVPLGGLLRWEVRETRSEEAAESLPSIMTAAPWATASVGLPPNPPSVSTSAHPTTTNALPP